MFLIQKKIVFFSNIKLLYNLYVKVIFAFIIHDFPSQKRNNVNIKIYKHQLIILQLVGIISKFFIHIFYNSRYI